jgi:RND family efflux transporter MFP subunit
MITITKTLSCVRRLPMVAGKAASISTFLLTLCVNARAGVHVGLVFPVHDTTLSAGVAGLVMKRLVEPGDRVRADQVLIQLDDRLQQLESDRRKAILQDQSEVDSVRERTRIIRTLLHDARAVFDKTGSISKEELLRLEADYVTSKGRLEQLLSQKKRESLDYESAERERLQRYITAPVDGVVVKVSPKIGEWAKPGDPIISLVDASTALLHLTIPHKEARTLKPGMLQPVMLDVSDVPYRTVGRISFVSPVADPASGLVEVRVSFPNSQLLVKPGIRGSIELP